MSRKLAPLLSLSLEELDMAGELDTLTASPQAL
jgi:hypothetical protein